MSKIFYAAFVCSLIAVVLSLTGCTKFTDVLSDEKQVTTSACRISQIIYPRNPIYYGDTITYNYSYNVHGDPVSIVSNAVGTGNPDRQFRYDAQKRLTDYIGEYSNAWFEFWHKYVYDNNGIVIRDTVFFWGEKGPVPTNYYDYAVVTYSYDVQGRISHTKQIWASDPGGAGLDLYYSYDSNGNLQFPNATYDNKISAHRTNDIWMFLDRNYSVNNANSSAWNGYGLPLKQVLTYDGGGALATVEGDTEVEIIYDCGNGAPSYASKK